MTKEGRVGGCEPATGNSDDDATNAATNDANDFLRLNGFCINRNRQTPINGGSIAVLLKMDYRR